MHFSEEKTTHFGQFSCFCDLDLDLQECLLRPFISNEEHIPGIYNGHL